MARTKKAEQEAVQKAEQEVVQKADQETVQETAPQETKSIEETFRELEAIVEKMEHGDSTLEESFASYEAGMKLVKECSLRLDKVEKQILVLAEDGGDYESQ